MGETDAETIRRTAALARLALGEDELARLAPQFARILEAFQHLARAPAPPAEDEAAPSARARADEPAPSLAREALLSQAPAAEDGFYLVPKTVESPRAGGGER